MQNLAHSLTQHAEDTFEIADIVLSGVVSRLESDGTDQTTLARTREFLRVRKGITRLRGVFAYDPGGRWLLSTEDVDLTVFNNRDRPYFDHHRMVDDRRVHIDGPFRSRSGGQWIITASRRFNNKDGSLGGIVLATIDAEYFSKYYDSFQLGEGGAIAVISQSGTIVSRSPDLEGYVGRDLSTTAAFTEAVGHRASVQYYRLASDGTERLSAVERSMRYPVMIAVSNDKAAILADWRTGATQRLIFVLIVTLLLGWAGTRLLMHLSERIRMSHAIREKEAEFRLLAEESSDLVMRADLKGSILYVSPSSMRLLDFPVETLAGTSIYSLWHDENHSALAGALEEMREGRLQETKIVHRAHHRSGETVWVETSLRATRSADKIDGVVAISRDVTAHKLRIENLSALAHTDGLTGVSNRRAFDLRLGQEWAAARKADTDLCLILLDVDHFKQYNDLYGHPGGDSCLRAVAAALTRVAAPHGGLVARYGGEEFALLLPGQNAEMCELIGEEALTAIRALKLPHARNQPSGIVTASAGGAVLRPSDGPSDLTAQVDRALYGAKAAGRNRLVVSEASEYSGRNAERRA